MAAPPEPLTVLRGHRAEVNCVRFGWADQSRQLLVSGCAANMTAVPTFPATDETAGRDSDILIFLSACLATSRDAAGDVLVWDLSTRRPCVTLSGAHTGGVVEVLILAGSGGDTAGGVASTSWIYTQGRDNSVCIWNLAELLAPADSTASTSRSRPVPVASLPDSDHSFCRMATCVARETVAASALEAEQLDLEPEPEASTKPSVELPPRLIGLASTTDNNLTIWDTRRRSAEVTIEARGDVDADAADTNVQSVVSDEAIEAVLTLLAGYEDGKLAVYTQAATGRWQLSAFVKLHEEPILSIADATYKSSKTGKRSPTRLVSCGADGRIALWEVQIQAPAQGVNAARVHIEPLTHEQATPSGAGAQGLRSADKAGMNQVAVRQDARLAATAGWDGTVRIFDLRKQLRLLAALTYHRDGVHTVAFATVCPASTAQPDGGAKPKPFGGTTTADPWLLASGGTDGRIALWRLYPPS